MNNSQKEITSEKIGIRWILRAVSFSALLLVGCVVIAYTFISSTYLGPILAAVFGVGAIFFGAMFGKRINRQQGDNSRTVSVMMMGALLLLISSIGTFTHVMSAHP